jgi:hypothetical protein
MFKLIRRWLIRNSKLVCPSTIKNIPSWLSQYKIGSVYYLNPLRIKTIDGSTQTIGEITYYKVIGVTEASYKKYIIFGKTYLLHSKIITKQEYDNSLLNGI